MAVASVGGEPPGDLASLARRIEQVGSSLEEQLRLLRDERDEEALRSLLPPVRSRVEQLVHAANGVRRGAIEASSGVTESELADLTADVDREVEALQAGVQALRSLTR